MKKANSVLPLLLLVLLPLAAGAVSLPVTYDSLDNGLRVLIVPDTNVAVVSCRLYYFVGSMYEGPGSSGLCHMYEHMLFKGTRTLGTTNYKKEKIYMSSIDSLDALIVALRQQDIPETDSTITSYRKEIFAILDKQREYIKKDEIWEFYLNSGGTHINGWTADDMTAYIVTLPRNKVELFYWIESDRMRNTVLREFYSERDVVTEERKMRYDNNPHRRYWERLFSLFYVAHPYRLPTIGWMSDIRSYTREALREHVRKFYTPDNALIVLAGNIDPSTAMADINRYFSTIPRASVPKKEVVTREPPPIGETRFTVHDDAQPRIDILFHTPGYPHDDLYKLDVVEGVLSGESGRLYKRLVRQTGLCTDAGAGNAYRLQDGYFRVWATLENDTDPREVESILLQEIAGLVDNPPSEREIERVRNSIRMFFLKSLKSLEGISDQLAWFERLRSWRDMETYPKMIAQVKAESIPGVVEQYLDPDLKAIGLLLPKQPADTEQGEGNKIP